MNLDERIASILLHLCGTDQAEVQVVWEDRYILSLRWTLRDGTKGAAKVLKLEQDWVLLSREI